MFETEVSCKCNSLLYIDDYDNIFCPVCGWKKPGIDIVKDTLDSQGLDIYSHDKNFDKHVEELFKAGFSPSEIYQLFLKNIKGIT